jgi:CheY-like chemotaxis protein/anti-sigma regulatory factor (Ser/Thr protein kinase)
VTIRTLLVDDAPDVRTLLRIALRARGGFEVVGEAETGAEATRLAGQLRPDVVVLDLGLPDLTARDLLAQIRRQSPTSRIVIFSGNESDRAWFEKRSSRYVVKDSALDDLLDTLTEVGATQAHDHAVVELPHDMVAVREARAVVRELLDRWGYDELVDDAALVVSELVTNAFEHTASSCAVVVNRSGGGVRIEVRDEGPGTPDPQPPSATAEGGRGLMIVSALATAWGVDSIPPTKSVWVELAVP